MQKPNYWNHNTAYYKWLKEQVKNSKEILDVGCGDGSLVAFLDDNSKNITGIDPDQSCINKTNLLNTSKKVQFIREDFESFESIKRYDSIIFVASIHHMEMGMALKKAKSLLSQNGKLLIVGLARPSTMTDYIIEILRVLPSSVISKIKKMHSSEDENIPVSYNLMKMSEVRKLLFNLFPNSKIRQGLFYRYLFEGFNR